MTKHYWMQEEHHAFREAVARLFREEFEPNRQRYTEAGVVDREFWSKAAEIGVLGASVPETHGGLGLSRHFDVVTYLQQALVGDTGWGFAVHNIATHYVAAYGTEFQKARWLPQLANGDLIAAIAMSEPAAGSDLKGVKTRAVADGETWVINGTKTFITNGGSADLLLLVAKTDPAKGSRGVSLMMVETCDLEGYQVGRKLDKLGMRRNDTAELFFEDVRIPASSLLGGEVGQGFYQLMGQLPWERLIIGYTALGSAQCALELTLDYVKQRKAFGQRIFDFQNTRFKLAEANTKIELLSAFLDQCLEELESGQLTAERAAMAKWWSTEAQCDIIDECLQLHGGYGYMSEYRISELYADARVQKIYGGTNEIMKEVIARSMDDPKKS
ncbi:MAG: acyl-CoA dehydrogenase [Gammaproteobacteria bacterium]|nr:acyl-CoA dehydrogenase [Gammaproteobacteria bacterium]